MPPSLEIIPFADGHADGAARLVADRQRHLRIEQPALPQRWTDVDEARSRLDALRADDAVSGVAAMDGDRLAGFLIGEIRLDPPWDRAAWVELAGHAVDPTQPDVARDLLAAWSAQLVSEMGVFRYLVHVPAVDRAAMEAWSQMNFGQMHCGAIRSTDAADLGEPDPAIVVRAAGPGDEPIMGNASELIWREQLSAPSWSPMLPERIESNRNDWIEELTLGDPVWIAEDAATHEPLGVAISYALDADLDIPDKNMKLASTATFPAARRRGVGRAMLRQVLTEAASRGAGWCVTDWRPSSLLASRAWTALGFERTRVRMERNLDPRVAWANGKG
jgi:ribosomal protein S18 acetylase RimI-like enzyme